GGKGGSGDNNGAGTREEKKSGGAGSGCAGALWFGNSPTSDESLPLRFIASSTDTGFKPAIRIRSDSAIVGVIATKLAIDCFEKYRTPSFSVCVQVASSSARNTASTIFPAFAVSVTGTVMSNDGQCALAGQSATDPNSIPNAAFQSAAVIPLSLRA